MWINILSSGIIASIVTILLNNKFDKDRYFRDLRAKIYLEFLSELNAIFPTKKLEENKRFEYILGHIYTFEKSIWKVDIIANRFIKSQAHIIFNIFEDIEKRLTNQYSGENANKNINEMGDKWNLWWKDQIIILRAEEKKIINLMSKYK